MKPTDFCFESPSGYRIGWHIEPPRCRTIFYKHKCLSLLFPWLVYSSNDTKYYDAKFKIFGSDQPITLTSKIYPLFLSHGFYDGSYCMTMNIDDFWQSNFARSVGYLDKAMYNQTHKNSWFRLIFRNPKKLTRVRLIKLCPYTLEMASQETLGSGFKLVRPTTHLAAPKIPLVLVSDGDEKDSSSYGGESSVAEA